MNDILKRVVVLGLLFLASCYDKKSDNTVQSADTEHTLIMFFPWSSNLTSYFYTNISDMKSAIASSILDDERVLVCFESVAGEANLFELEYRDGACEEVILKSYTGGFTTKEALTTLFDDVVSLAPAANYSLSIGAHGMGWLPISSKTQSVMQRSAGVEGEQELQQPHYLNAVGKPYTTRYFGGTTAEYQIEISTLREAIEESKMEYLEYILFDDCYMANIEIAYELREIVGYLIASPTEIMGYGFPYELIGCHLLGDIDYAGVVEEYYNFYSTFYYPYATIGVINCSQTEAIAAIMAEINAAYSYEGVDLSSVQRMDGYSPVIFYDFGSYVEALCPDEELLARFNEQLERLVPDDHKAHTGKFPSNVSWFTTYTITSFSGVTISDASQNTAYSVTESKLNTDWYIATHPSSDEE